MDVTLAETENLSTNFGLNQRFRTLRHDIPAIIK